MARRSPGSKRHGFSKTVIQHTGKRAAFRCSNPKCNRLTIGPTKNTRKGTNLGVAAHMSAASPRGPRYDASLTKDQRSSAENAIWLCQSCAKRIDDDPDGYTLKTLKRWKAQRERRATRELERGAVARPPLPEDCTDCRKFDRQEDRALEAGDFLKAAEVADDLADHLEDDHARSRFHALEARFGQHFYQYLHNVPNDTAQAILDAENMTIAARSSKEPDMARLATHLGDFARGLQLSRTGQLDQSSDLFAKARRGLRRWKRENLWSAVLLDPFLKNIELSALEIEAVSLLRAGRIDQAQDTIDRASAEYAQRAKEAGQSTVLEAYANVLSMLPPLAEGHHLCLAGRFADARSRFEVVEQRLTPFHQALRDDQSPSTFDRRIILTLGANTHTAIAFGRACRIREQFDRGERVASHLARTALDHLDRAEALHQELGHFPSDVAADWEQLRNGLRQVADVAEDA